MKAPGTIKRELRRLRRLVDNSEDAAVARIAYAMENTLRWATEPVVGWQAPSEDAIDEAKCMWSELAERTKKGKP